jgi:hypothetical protein
MSSLTIQMPTQFDQVFKSVINDAVGQAVAAMAAKHGFDAEEEMRSLNLEETKLVRKRGPSPKKTEEKSVAKPKKDKKKKKKEEDGDKPKRAKTGYLLFQDHLRAETKLRLEAELGDGAKLQSKEVIREIAAIWKALAAEEQQKWKDIATGPPTGRGATPRPPPRMPPSGARAAVSPTVRRSPCLPSDGSETETETEPEPEPAPETEVEEDEEE